MVIRPRPSCDDDVARVFRRFKPLFLVRRGFDTVMVLVVGRIRDMNGKSNAHRIPVGTGLVRSQRRHRMTNSLNGIRYKLCYARCKYIRCQFARFPKTHQEIR